MGGGNGQKSKMARERNSEKNKAAKGAPLLFLHHAPSGSPILFVFSSCDCSGRVLRSDGSACFRCAGSQLETNKKAMSIQVHPV